MADVLFLQDQLENDWTMRVIGLVERLMPAPPQAEENAGQPALMPVPSEYTGTFVHPTYGAAAGALSSDWLLGQLLHVPGPHV
jgi:hypothetical protein